MNIEFDLLAYEFIDDYPYLYFINLDSEYSLHYNIGGFGYAKTPELVKSESPPQAGGFSDFATKIKQRLLGQWARKTASDRLAFRIKEPGEDKASIRSLRVFNLASPKKSKYVVVAIRFDDYDEPIVSIDGSMFVYIYTTGSNYSDLGFEYVIQVCGPNDPFYENVVNDFNEAIDVDDDLRMVIL